MPSVIKPEASACNHSILTLRHQSALQQYKPIINPQDVPTPKSFPSRPEADHNEATFSHLVRIHFRCHCWQEYGDSGLAKAVLPACIKKDSF